ncbi:MAG: 5'-methylthioadenosine/adenosylhomocysteine nucleosidase [Clostridiales bacterium]|nr:5'-methylthioadenosine/adenosylhomocysteine nucleosidase [Clostridiales bacterium]
MIGIIGAMSVEVDKLKSLIEDKMISLWGGIEFASGKINGKSVVVAKCGIGKVFAAVCTQTMILKFSPDVIINTGVAGAVSSELHPGDVVVAKDTVQYDMDTTAFGDPLGLISGLDIVHIPCLGSASREIAEYAKEKGINTFYGTLACADRFLNDKSTKNMLKEKFNALACDMESGSINHVCYLNNTSCAVVRAISDTADGGSVDDYTRFLSESAQKAVEVVLEYIDKH